MVKRLWISLVSLLVLSPVVLPTISAWASAQEPQACAMACGISGGPCCCTLFGVIDDAPDAHHDDHAASAESAVDAPWNLERPAVASGCESDCLGTMSSQLSILVAPRDVTVGRAFWQLHEAHDPGHSALSHDDLRARGPPSLAIRLLPTHC